MAANIETAQKTVAELQDEGTAELEASIANIDAINVKVRANADKVRAQQEADELSGQYNDLSAQIDGVRKARLDLLEKAQMPLDGLSVTEGELTYQGQKWDCMSGAEQLKVSTAIIRCLNPECGFVLMDKLEQMDRHTLAASGTGWNRRACRLLRPASARTIRAASSSKTAMYRARKHRQRL